MLLNKGQLSCMSAITKLDNKQDNVATIALSN